MLQTLASDRGLTKIRYGSKALENDENDRGLTNLTMQQYIIEFDRTSYEQLPKPLMKAASLQRQTEE